MRKDNKMSYEQFTREELIQEIKALNARYEERAEELAKKKRKEYEDLSKDYKEKIETFEKQANDLLATLAEGLTEEAEHLIKYNANSRGFLCSFLNPFRTKEPIHYLTHNLTLSMHSLINDIKRYKERQ